MKILNEVFANGRIAPLSASSVKRCFSSIAEAVNGSFLHWNVQTFQTFRTCSHAGFTVLELLVASLLLGMLVTMLTMIFNQSSIAWRTGISSVCELETTREQMGGYHDVTDDALPGVGQPGNRGIDDTSRKIEYRTVSLFRKWNGSGMSQNQSLNCVGRLIDRIDWGSENLSQLNAHDVMKGQVINGLNQGSYANGRGGYIVGVRSSGPDRDMSTEDDNINTFPEDVE